MSELEVLNGLCNDLYMGGDPGTRLRAEQNLAELAESPECLRRCLLLLDQGIIPYGPLVASNTLLKLLNKKTGITPTQKLEVARYLLSMLGGRSSSLPPYCVTSLSQLFARICKQEWVYSTSENPADFPFREPIPGIIKAIEADNEAEQMLALQLMNMIVVDMNSNVGMESVSKHRKSMSQFRDEHLMNIFNLTVTILQQKVIDTQPQANQLPMLNAVLELCLNCLLFDYIGSLSDETSDDNYTVQIPTSWKQGVPMLAEGKIVTMFFQLYTILPQQCTEKVMHILVQLASIRRTLFTGSERQVCLEQFVIGVKGIIESPDKLLEQGAFHEFSRLVARLKTNYQLLELIKITQYPAMMRLLAEFTVHSLGMMELTGNSTYFLLTFWQRMVASVPYVRNNDDHQLEMFCPEIVDAFVKSRLLHVQNVICDGADDPLEDQGSSTQILEQVAVICRCNYDKTYALLARCFDENVQIVQSGGGGKASSIAEGRLVWLVTLIGTAIYGRTTVSSAKEEHDKMDGELLARVLKLMQYCDSRLEFASINTAPRNGNFRIEVAFMHVLENFRKAYIMEQVTRATPVYDPLRDLNISEETDMLSVITQKVLTNLKYWALNENILDISLSLFKDLSLGYTAVRKLFRLPEVQLLLNNHTSEHFAFLGSSVNFQTMKQRTVFYEALTRLLTIDLNDDETMFANYMQPITATVNQILRVMSSTSPTVDEAELVAAVVGLYRDLRGIAVACTTKSLFQIIFDWLYPDVFTIMLRCVEAWPERAEVTTPMFRLLAELCQNRQQRLKLELNSCSAVLLFREMSKIIHAYGNRLLMLPDVDREHAYKLRYKNMGIVFHVMKYALTGQYVPFGVFRLYGDSCLQDALQMFVRLFRKIPEDDLLGYTKLAENYYTLLEAILQDNMPFISNVEVETFVAVLKSVHGGVMSLDLNLISKSHSILKMGCLNNSFQQSRPMCADQHDSDSRVVTAACSSLDNLVNYLYKRFTRTKPAATPVGHEPEGDNCLLAVKQHPQIMAEMLTTMMSELMFAEVKCQWSMSRPLLGLILLQEEVFASFKDDIVRQQPTERQPPFVQAFGQLMEGVERSLQIKNKDIFTQNLAKFRRDVVEIVKGRDPSPPTTHPDSMC